MYLAERLSAQLGGARIYFKRDELTHTGAHKINNTIGQILLARRMGKRRIIAETGAGQHGVATATVAARLGLECVVYMGARDIERQRPNVFRMRLLGAEVRAVRSGSATLKDAMNEALRDWVGNVDTPSTSSAPSPARTLPGDGARLPGRDRQRGARADHGQGGRLPDTLVACIGGGSNAIGLFHPFLDEPEVRMIGVEAAGHGIETASTPRRCRPASPASCTARARTSCRTTTARCSRRIRSPPGSTTRAWAGARLAEGHGRVEYVPITDEEALGAFRLCSELEGILPALEPAHARACGQDCARAAERPSDRHESVRPGRQGHLHRGGRHGGRPVSERIERRFAELREAGRGGLITFLCAGDPDPETSAEILAAAGRGRDLIEIGMPFSDPMADGPAIQAGSLRALRPA